MRKLCADHLLIMGTQMSIEDFDKIILPEIDELLQDEEIIVQCAAFIEFINILTIFGDSESKRIIDKIITTLEENLSPQLLKRVVSDDESLVNLSKEIGKAIFVLRNHE